MRDIEVDSEEGPLALNRVGYGLDGAHVEGDPSGRRVRDQYCVVLHVDIDLAWCDVLRILLNTLERLQSIHLFDFVFLRARVDFPSLEPHLKFSLLFIV